MYKLMLVEDEELIRKGIAKSIDWKKFGFEIVAEACNGSEALGKIELEKPDVVLTDIRMPVMDGLELAKRINEKYSDIKIIILSGFADFEIARSAIKFKVYDYLLKPTDKKVFIETFQRLKEQLDREAQELDSSLNMRKKLNEGLMKLREEFLLNLVKGEAAPSGILRERADFLELDLSGGNFTASVIYIHGDMKDILTEWGNEESLLMFSYANIVQELLDVLNCGVVVVKDVREIVVVFNFKENEPGIDVMTHIIEQSISYIDNLIFKGNPLSISAGIGLTYPDITQLNKSYTQAQRALERKFYANDKKVFIYEESDDTDIDFEKKWVKSYPDEVNLILSETMAGNAERVGELIRQFFNRCIGEKLNSKFIKNYCYVLFFLLKGNMAEFKDQLDVQAVLLADYENEIKNIYSIQDLQKLVEDTFVGISRQISALRESKASYHRKVIDNVKEYIDRNYCGDLSLEQLSKQVFLSPVYLSFLFKSITGENYMDYLKRIRLEKAKALLKKVEYKVYEIGNMVGYNDYKYFSIQFKKMYGMTPTEYREQNI